MFLKNTIDLMRIYEQLKHTVSWFQIQNRMRLIAELESIRVIKPAAGSKVHPILYDIYECEWDRNNTVPVCDMV